LNFELGTSCKLAPAGGKEIRKTKIKKAQHS
jgi:hypothetical protein